jgi:hypothetical protein
MPSVGLAKREVDMRDFLFGLLFALITFAPKAGCAETAIPPDNLAYPALITFDNGSSGSGFFINTASRTYLVTAAHVLFDETTGNLRGKQATILSYSKDPKEVRENIWQLDLPTLFAAKEIRKHSAEDVAVVHVAEILATDNTGQNSLKWVTGVSELERAPLGFVGVGLDNIKHFESILISNTIYMFGYPTSLGIKDLPQIDPHRPLLRFGIIAGTNPGRKTIILDCPSYPGNSGGPVLEIEQVDQVNRVFRVIGVVIQYVPFAETWVNLTQKYQSQTITNSGYTIAVSMEPVLELISHQ